ncbi:hypothetical protein GCM10022234_00560 [Aeromicrobium panaciterrae]|uniref:hypothetical protein n=1 Tax=Aeromicrobium panaciterrae TaxID=363861 RepID=UPI0031D71E9A
MKIRLALTFEVTRDKPIREDITVDMVGHLQDLPAATSGIGFIPDPDEGHPRKGATQ